MDLRLINLLSSCRVILRRYKDGPVLHLGRNHRRSRAARCNVLKFKIINRDRNGHVLVTNTPPVALGFLGIGFHVLSEVTVQSLIGILNVVILHESL